MRRWVVLVVGPTGHEEPVQYHTIYSEALHTMRRFQKSARAGYTVIVREVS